ncbi:MAG: hypothetical protein AB8B50_02155 [Pirellulaceae bacterium]
METVLLVVGLVCLLALYPAWVVGRRAYYQSEKWRKYASVFWVLVLGPAFAFGLILLPFFMNEGKTLKIDALVTDFILYSVLPASAVGGICYVLNQLSESDRPVFLVIAAAACLAIVLLGPALYLYTSPLLEKFEITMEMATA